MDELDNKHVGDSTLMHYLLALIRAIGGGVDAKQRHGRRRWGGYIEPEVDGVAATEGSEVSQSLEGNYGVLRKKKGQHVKIPYAAYMSFDAELRDIVCNMVPQLAKTWICGFLQRSPRVSSCIVQYQFLE